MITIVIPFRNRKSALAATLQSVAAASHPQAHWVLVDNGSTDGAREMCDEFVAQHSGGMDIRCISCPEAGAARARNAGLAVAETPWTYFFDSDDLFDNRFFSVVLPRLSESIDLLALTVNLQTANGLCVRAFQPTADPVAQVLASHLGTHAMLVRTSRLRQVGGWNEALSVWDDWELGLRLLLSFAAETDGEQRVEWLTQPHLHTILPQTESITGTAFGDKTEALLRALSAAHDDVCAAQISDRLAQRLKRALRLRHEILQGLLLREGNTAAAQQCGEQKLRLFGKGSAAIRLVGSALRKYTAHGGRGAWRIALAL